MYIKEGLRYPFKDYGALFIGGILSLLFFLLIPLLFVLGYLIRVMENTVKNVEEMPKWENLGDLLVKGICYVVISLVYLIIPTIIFIVVLFMMGGGFSILGSALKDSGGILAAIGTMFFGLIVVILLYLLFSVLSILALIRYAETGNIGSAFEFGFVIGKFKKNIVGYIGTIILLGILSSVISFLLGVLSMFLIGFVLFPFAIFYMLLVNARSLSMIYRST